MARQGSLLHRRAPCPSGHPSDSFDAFRCKQVQTDAPPQNTGDLQHAYVGQFDAIAGCRVPGGPIRLITVDAFRTSDPISTAKRCFMNGNHACSSTHAQIFPRYRSISSNSPKTALTSAARVQLDSTSQGRISQPTH